MKTTKVLPTENIETRYRKNVLDMSTQLGCLKEAMIWLWLDVVAYQSQEVA